MLHLRKNPLSERRKALDRVHRRHSHCLRASIAFNRIGCSSRCQLLSYPVEFLEVHLSPGNCEGRPASMWIWGSDGRGATPVAIGSMLFQRPRVINLGFPLPPTLYPDLRPNLTTRSTLPLRSGSCKPASAGARSFCVVAVLPAQSQGCISCRSNHIRCQEFRSNMQTVPVEP